MEREKFWQHFLRLQYLAMPEFRDSSGLFKYRCHGNPPCLPHFASHPPTPLFKNSVTELDFLLGVILPKKFNMLHVVSPLEGVAHSLYQEQAFRGVMLAGRHLLLDLLGRCRVPATEVTLLIGPLS